MLIEQKIEVNGNRISITRTVQKQDSAAPISSETVFSTTASKGSASTDLGDSVDHPHERASTSPDSSLKASPAVVSTPAAAQGKLRLFVLRPGGGFEELGPGGGMEDLGPGGNLAGGGITLVFGPVNVNSCCHCHGHAQPEDAA